MLVRVYRDLNHGGYSIQSKSSSRGWRVVGHANYLRLTNAHFKVYEKARQRVIRQSRKAVHAFVVGTLDGSYATYNTEELSEVKKISYNPYRWGYFFKVEDQSAIHNTSCVYFTPWGVYGK